MPWYLVKVAHDRMARGLVVELKASTDVKRRVERGYLVKAEKPEWSRDQGLQVRQTKTPTADALSKEDESPPKPDA